MAVLTEADRDEIWAELMRRVPDGSTFPVTKTTFRDLVDACDQVISDTAPETNQAIQALNPSWNMLSVAMRSYVYTGIVTHRYGRGL